MIGNKIFEINVEILINNSLYKNNIIDENTYRKANDSLLKELYLIK